MLAPMIIMRETEDGNAVVRGSVAVRLEGDDDNDYLVGDISIGLEREDKAGSTVMNMPKGAVVAAIRRLLDAIEGEN